MGAIKISTDDKTNVKDFDDGNSITVRVTVNETETNEYTKGKTVSVKYGSQEARAKIVSEPIVIDDKKEKGKRILSLVVEKV